MKLGPTSILVTFTTVADIDLVQISHGPTRIERAQTLGLSEWCCLVLALVAVLAPFDPDHVLKYGGWVCFAVLLMRFTSIKMDSPNLLAVGLTMWAILSRMWTIDATVTGLAVSNQLSVLAIFLGLRTAITNRRGLLIIAWGYLAGCLYAVYLLYRDNSTAVDILGDRYGITGLNINYLAYALAVGLAVSLLLWVTSTKRPTRFLLSVCVISLTVAIWSSGTRGALVAIALLALWVVVYRISPEKMLKFAWLAVGVSAAAIVTGAAESVLTAVDSLSSRSTGDLSARLIVWPIARHVFEQHILTGAGSGGFSSLDPIGIGAHNVILEIGAGLGVVGVIFFLGVYISSLVSATRATPARLRSLLVGALLLVSSPIYLSGQWELSPAAWIVLGLFSRVPLLSTGTAAGLIDTLTTKTFNTQRESVVR